MLTTVDRDAYPVAWREAGSGPVALFLHGLGGSRTSWDEQLLWLGHLRRCVAWDMPGYGASSGTPSSLAEIADAAATLCRELSAGPVDVIGLSLGGMVAQHLALRHPDVVRSLVLLDTSPAFGLDGTTAEDWLHARLAPLDAGRTVADIAPQVIGSIAGRSATAEQRAAAVSAMCRIDATALELACRALVQHDVRDELHHIAVPTLVVVGEDDDETPVSYSQVIADRVPGARLEILNDTGHLSNVESPDEVNALIEKFWTSVEEHS